MNWYVQVENQAYGPYSEVQMQGFVEEGRINGESLISNAKEQGFFAAVGYDVFTLWNGTGQAMAVGGSAAVYQPQEYVPIQPAPKQPIQEQPVHVQPIQEQPVYEQYSNRHLEPATPEPQTQSSIYLVMAEIRSEGAMGFLKTLQNFGIAQRIGDTVWLLRSTHAVEKVRNTLSQSLNRQDRLFILDATHNKTAWFNIGADLDHRIRELWNEDDD